MGEGEDKEVTVVMFNREKQVWKREVVLSFWDSTLSISFVP